MYVPLRDESLPLQIKIPWDNNTARGFVIALAILAIFLLLAPVVDLHINTIPDFNITTVPMDVLNFGEGDGTGISKGNLSKEGEAHKGEKPASELQDASIATKTRIVTNATSNDIDNASNFIPKKELASNQKNDNNAQGDAAKNIGNPNGTEQGTGIGNKGIGPGAGSGLGDIEWGGGGNRTVLYKKLPKYPSGVNTNARIKIKFIVGPDGTVTSMFPLQKGDPVLEKAAMDALRQWRFNRLSVNKDMSGIITFTFKVS
jgi:TonB family protein